MVYFLSCCCTHHLWVQSAVYECMCHTLRLHHILVFSTRGSNSGQKAQNTSLKHGVLCVMHVGRLLLANASKSLLTKQLQWEHDSQTLDTTAGHGFTADWFCYYRDSLQKAGVVETCMADAVTKLLIIAQQTLLRLRCQN